LTDRNVLFAGYKVTHPLKYDIDIKIQTVHDTTPREVLQQAVQDLIEQITTLKQEFQDEVAKKQKHHTIPSEMYGSSTGVHQYGWEH
jgi:DNA-directed RNA polymerase II subunit RPB11